MRSMSGAWAFNTFPTEARMKRYELSREDGKLICSLLLEFATELDLHYNDGDLNALTPSFAIIKDALALLKRANFEVHPDVINILARYNKSRQ